MCKETEQTKAPEEHTLQEVKSKETDAKFREFSLYAKKLLTE